MTKNILGKTNEINNEKIIEKFQFKKVRNHLKVIIN